MNHPLPTVVFSHANSFGAGTYSLMLDNLRQRGFRVVALEQFGHDPRYPVTDNWPHLVQQLADFAQAEVQASGAPVFLVGHSMGAILSLLAAAQHPKLCCGVLMIDAPMVSGWRALSVRLAKLGNWFHKLSPAKVSHRRRTSWPSEAAALASFTGKKVFARWHPQVLHDYVHHGTHDEGAHRVLSFTREVETAIYNSLPHNLDALLRRHPLQCPLAYIGGLQSEEMKMVGVKRVKQLAQGRLSLVDGSHLFPMEDPLMTAAAIEMALRNLHHHQRRR